MMTRVLGARSGLAPVLLWVAVATMGCSLAFGQQNVPYGSVTGKVVDKDTGRPLDFSNVVVLGTQMGANARNGGSFNIGVVPVGTYTLKATFVGYDPQTLTNIRVDAGKPTVVEFRLKKGEGTRLETVKVTGKTKAIDVKSSDVSHVQTSKEILTLPVESVTEAVALNTGVVVQGGELHV